MDEHERRMDEHARLCSCLEWPLFTPGFPGVGSPRGSKLEKSLESTRGLSCPGGIGGCWLQRHAPVAQQKPPETHGLRRLRAEELLSNSCNCCMIASYIIIYHISYHIYIYIIRYHDIYHNMISYMIASYMIASY